MTATENEQERTQPEMTPEKKKVINLGMELSQE